MHSELATSDKDFPVISQCGGKKIYISTFGQLEPFAQFSHACGKVADSQIGFLCIVEQFFYFAFAESTPAVYVERAAGEMGQRFVGGIEVAVGMKFLYLIYMGQAAESAGFE